MTHIMWLTNLAPDIQEAILFLPRAESGPDTVKEIGVRRITYLMDLEVQRALWWQRSSDGGGWEGTGWLEPCAAPEEGGQRATSAAWALWRSIDVQLR